MKQLIILLTLLIYTNTTHASDTTYYKCASDKGTVFSQLPCSPNAIEQKIVTQNPEQGPTQNHFKTLNNLERTQIIRNLNGEIRSKKHEIAILKRERDRAEYQQKQRTKRILSDDEVKRIKKDITKQIALLDKVFTKELKDKNKQLAKLEKKLASYQ